MLWVWYCILHSSTLPTSFVKLLVSFLFGANGPWYGKVTVLDKSINSSNISLVYIVSSLVAGSGSKIFNFFANKCQPVCLSKENIFFKNFFYLICLFVSNICSLFSVKTSKIIKRFDMKYEILILSTHISEESYLFKIETLTFWMQKEKLDLKN